MWSYEIIFHYPDRSKKRTRPLSIPMKELSETVASESEELVLQYVSNELKIHEDYELVAIVRRNAILTILKDK